LVTGATCYYIVGAYIPPSDPGTLEHVRDALAKRPANCRPLLLDILNVNLDIPWTERDKAVADVVDGEDLVDMTKIFC
jgi:hypothetical protein